MAAVVVVGASNTDLTSYVPRLPAQGETILGTKFKTGFGGKGANQCVMAAKLGSKCCMITKLGEDGFGQETKANYAKYNILSDFVYTTSEASTGVAPIAVDSNGRNSIIVVKGANDLLTPAEVQKAADVIAHAAVVVCQLEIAPATTLAALRLAKTFPNVKTIFNPAPAQDHLDDEFYKLSDIFCPNETEASILTGITVSDLESAKAASQVLLGRGVGTVIVTLGAQGAWIEGAGLSVHVPATKVTAVDTSGAGDAFIGSLAHFIASNPALPLPEMVRRACAISTITVQHEGTQSSFPDAKDVPNELLA